MTESTVKKNLIRWGIIGCGDVTEVKSGPAFKKTKGFQVVAVMRRDPVKVKDYAERHSIKKYYVNADELINDKEVDAVYVATPPDTHKYYGIKVAEAGKPCCVEKPMTPSYKESLALSQAFIKKGLPLFVAYYRRSLPRFKQVKAWIENDEIGQVRHIRWNLNKSPGKSDLSGAYNWRTDPKVAPGGYFDDLASHGLDLFTYLLGNIKEVYGISLNQQGLYQAKDTVTACWLHDKGTTGSGNWNFGSGMNEDRVIISGSTGQIEFSIFDDNPLIIKNRESAREVYIENPVNIQVYHVEDMRNHLLKANFKHPSSGVSGAHTSWIMDKILGTI